MKESKKNYKIKYYTGRIENKNIYSSGPSSPLHPQYAEGYTIFSLIINNEPSN
jgi:hypothetical protein